MSSERVSAGLSVLEPSYDIERELGRGETSVVYLARERASNDQVAIKLVRPKYLGDEETMGRFVREARFLQRLAHPHVVRVRAVLELGDAGLAIVMVYVPGRTLKEVIQSEGRLAPERAERLTRDIASALGAAHAMGIVHRDVKPENVFVDSDDRPLLADFGLARSMASDSQVTMAGVAIGTPAYMAPEQIDGAPLDARGDVYSLGLLAWEMLSGRRPWEGESLYAVLYHQRYDELPDVRELRDDVPATFADAIAVAIEKNPDMRWQNIAQMIEGLDGSPRIKPTTKRPRLSAETVRFTRPPSGATQIDGFSAGAPAPAAARESPPIASDALASVAAELEAQERARVSKTRRRYVLSIGGVAVVLALTAIAAKARRSSDVFGAPTQRLDMAPRQVESAQIAIASAEIPHVPRPPREDAETTSVTMQSDAAKKDTTRDSKYDFRKASLKPATTANNAAVTPASAPAPSVAPLIGPRPSRVTVAAGGLHSCMVNADGRASCWGSNDRGQLGAGSASSQATPVVVAGDVRFTMIATGLAHSCAVARSGGVWCWGENDRGQLGDRSTLAHQAPVRVAESRVVTTVAVGVAHSCALDSQGGALCWGANARGQLGSGNSSGEIGAPIRVAGDHRYSSIALGWNFACALDDGHAFCWGENDDGQLGDGSTTDRRVPVAVVGDLTFRSIAAGANHACALTARGEAYCWGNNRGGQLGDGTRVNREVPTAVNTSLQFVAIATGALHTCALTADGLAFCWGRDNYGQLGDGGSTQDSVEPVRVAGNHAFAAVRAFGSHTCATTAAGEAFCWGYNLDGQLGDGSRVNRSRPVYVEPPPGT